MNILFKTKTKRDQLFSSLSSNDVLTSNINETDETMSYSTDQLLVHQDRILAGKR